MEARYRGSPRRLEPRSEPGLLVSSSENAATRTRTWDNLGNNQVLYQLSYGGSLSPT